MRLLNTKSLTLNTFFGDTPPYAILSHTWDQDEVSFQDMHSGHMALANLAGFRKIEAACRIAVADGFQYIWIDTCCIDKSSSSELSEAINSMFQWYQKAVVCYVYLSDVGHGSKADILQPDSAFRTSRWFKRGWTLQELIAPSSLIFFSREWSELGTKSSLKDIVSEVTTIQSEVLSGQGGTTSFSPYILQNFSIAQKMSWTASRETTREEDSAYSLMGIFDVHMPMLYGEGKFAFIRLQEEIMKRSCDQTIFAWKSLIFGESGLLASSASFFAESGNIVRAGKLDTRPFVLTNRGINMELQFKQSNNSAISFAVLDCMEIGHADSRLSLVVTNRGNTGVYSRIKSNQLQTIEKANVNESYNQILFRAYQKRAPNPYTPGSRVRIDMTNLQEHGFWANLVPQFYHLKIDEPIDLQFDGIPSRVPGQDFLAALRISNGTGKYCVLLLARVELGIFGIMGSAIRARVSKEFVPLETSVWQEMEESDRFQWYDPERYPAWGIDVALRRRCDGDENYVSVSVNIINCTGGVESLAAF
jgi:hypothetical protein